MKYQICILLYSIGIIFSCSPKYYSDIEGIKKCSDYKIHKLHKMRGVTHLDNEIDFYKGIEDLELILQKNAVLPRASKEAYKKLISDIEADRIPKSTLDTISKQLVQSLKNNNISNIDGEVFNLVFRCFENALLLNEDLKDSPIYKQKESANIMYMTGGSLFTKKDMYNLIDVVTIKDFEQEIIYRAALVLCLYDNIRELTNPSIKYYNYRNQEIKR